MFEHSLQQTPGDDLAKLLLLKSPSSEVWFDRRTNFTRSLAVMSMVGYVLGLGDRHPSNLLLDRNSGKILHIDFGDCFEVKFFSTILNICEQKTFSILLVLKYQYLNYNLGCYDQREVPRKDSFQTNKV